MVVYCSCLRFDDHTSTGLPPDYPWLFKKIDKNRNHVLDQKEFIKASRTIGELLVRVSCGVCVSRADSLMFVTLSFAARITEKDCPSSVLAKIYRDIDADG